MASKKLFYAVAITCFLYASTGGLKMMQETESSFGAIPEVLILAFILLAPVGIGAICYAHLPRRPKPQDQVQLDKYCDAQRFEKG